MAFDDNFASQRKHQKGKGRLWRWVCFSGILHSVFLLSVFLIPQTAFRSAVSYPVYSVELVGGEKIGGGGSGARKDRARRAKKNPKRLKKKTPPQVVLIEKVKRTKKVKQAKKARKKIVTKKPRRKSAPPKKKPRARKKKLPRDENVVALSVTKKKKETPTATGKKLPEPVRDRLIQAAIDRVKQRAATARKKESKSSGVISDPAKTDGAAATGPGGRGGGIAKGIKFLIYRNRMLYQIKERWTWVGKRTDLEVTVRFNIQEDGKIMGLKIAKASGDFTYDESVLRAVRRANPLPPPPSDYKKDFSRVELTFRPTDLS